jgi:hypothetical protein
MLSYTFDYNLPESVLRENWQESFTGLLGPISSCLAIDDTQVQLDHTHARRPPVSLQRCPALHEADRGAQPGRSGSGVHQDTEQDLQQRSAGEQRQQEHRDNEEKD